MDVLLLIFIFKIIKGKMKNFRKNNNSLFICEECQHLFHKKDKLSYHINRLHDGIKEYYDKWLKENNEGYCKICNLKTQFINFSYNYKLTCSKKCGNLYRHQQKSKAIKNKYGDENVWNISKFQQKCINSKIKKYGLPHNISKTNNTIFIKYGVKNILQISGINDKKIKTCLSNYGVEHPAQDPSISEKIQKTGFKIKKFKNTNIWYQGSYELDFLEKYYNKFPDIERGPSIKYLYENKNKVYHSDFYIPSLNLIIECKNSYLIKIDKDKINAKQQFSIYNGYNYILIIDKNYDEFRKAI